MTHPFRTRHVLVLAASAAAAAGAVLLPTGAFAAPAATPHGVVADSAPGDPCSGPGNPACSSGPQSGTIGPVDEGGGIVVNPGGTPPAAEHGPGKQGPGKHGRGKNQPGKDLPVTGGTGAGGWVQPPDSRGRVCDVAPCGPSTQPRIEAL